MTLYKISTIDNSVVATYPSVKAACEELKMEASCIRRAISGVTSSSYGFRWCLTPPKVKTDTRRRVEDLKAAKELSELFGGDAKDYLEAVRNGR